MEINIVSFNIGIAYSSLEDWRALVVAHDIFISYSSVNKAAADAICHALEQNGVKCWIAPRDIQPGANYGGEIIRGIKDCKVFLLVFSKDANASPAVAKEVERAVLGYKKMVIPFRIEDVAMSENLEFFLTDVHWLDAFPDDTVFGNLVTAVRNALGMNSAPSFATAPQQMPGIAPVSVPEQNVPTPVDVGIQDCAAGNANQIGNTAGNLNNAGSAAIQGDWIYFCSSGNMLYKTKSDDSSGFILLADAVDSYGYLNVVDDWIYYNDAGSGISRIRTDGTGKENVFGKSFSNTVIVGKDLYYKNTEAFNAADFSSYFSDCPLIKRDLQTGNEKVIKGHVTSFVVADGKIVGYVTRPVPQGSAKHTDCFTVDFDGNILKNWREKHWIKSLVMMNGCYYFIEEHDALLDGDEISHVVKKPLQGNAVAQLAECADLLNVTDDWIYYNCGDDKGSWDGLWKMRHDGSEKTKLFDGYTNNLSVVGDWLFYQSADAFCRMRTDGTDEEILP